MQRFDRRRFAALVQQRLAVSRNRVVDAGRRAVRDAFAFVGQRADLLVGQAE
jgi:hypothetical protein